MVIIDTVVNTLFGGLTLDPAGMHCPSWDDAFVSSVLLLQSILKAISSITIGPVSSVFLVLKSHEILVCYLSGNHED